MTLSTTGDHDFNGHTVALAEELARRAATTCGDIHGVQGAS
ncbi:hypothetical protein [Streptomyces sp. NPDC001568]